MKLIIIGAGNVGGFLSYNMQDFGTYEVVGFLDDDYEKIGKEFYELKVLGNVDDIDLYITDHEPLAVVIGIASPHVKKIIKERLKGKHIIYPRFISKSCWISKKVKIGEGVIVYPGVSINYETSIDEFVVLNMNCAIGHNCTISAYSTLAPGVNLAGYTFLKQGVEMGIGSATLQNIEVGEYSIIGGQTMLIRSVPDYAVVVGNPGRIIKYNKI